MVQCYGQETPVDGRHQKNDRRHQLINEIKDFIKCIEQQDVGGQQQLGGGGGGCTRVTASADLEKECREFRKRQECEPPTITTISVHETRPTSDYSNMQYENTRHRTYIDATAESRKPMPPAPWELPRKPSQELRGGVLYQNCDCVRRNGLQQDCPRWHCGGRPECVAVNPGPCCWTSQARKPTRGDRRSYKPSSDEEQKSSPYPGFTHCEIPGLNGFSATNKNTGCDAIEGPFECKCVPVTGPTGVNSSGTPGPIHTPGVLSNPRWGTNDRFDEFVAIIPIQYSTGWGTTQQKKAQEFSTSTQQTPSSPAVAGGHGQGQMRVTCHC